MSNKAAALNGSIVLIYVGMGAIALTVLLVLLYGEKHGLPYTSEKQVERSVIQ